MNWPMAALGDVAEFINGAAFKPTDWEENGRRIIRIQNLTDPEKPYNRTTKGIASKYEIPKGTLLVSWSASLGVFEWKYEDTAVLNQHIFKVIPNTAKVDQSYLRHMLADALVSMQKFAHGSTMIHINRGEFLSTRIPLPPLIEQRRIVAILDQADEIRIKAMQALTYVRSATSAVYSDMFNEAEIEPHNWTVLSSIVSPHDSINYGVVQPGREVDEGISLVRAGDLLHYDLNYSSLRKISTEVEGAYRRSRLNGNEILIACVGSIGAIALATKEMRGFNIARAVARVPIDPLIADRRFIGAQLKSLRVQRYFQSETRTVAQPTLNIKQIKETKIYLPPLCKQHEFRSRVIQISRSEQLIGQSQMITDALFTSLQHRAFRGEL